MTAAAVRPGSVSTVAAPRRSSDAAVPAPPAAATRAVAYQRVLHQMVRRELRLLAELSTWAPPGEHARTAALTAHADLMSRVLLHHHAVERELLWPALLLSVPADRADEVRVAHAD
jgi:Hemerythrin HHE cation binding domain